MKVVLLEKIHNLGGLGDVVEVKPGYARNFLFPYEKALSATKENMAEFEARRAELEANAKDALTKAEGRAKLLEGVELLIEANAQEDGKLFGSIGVREIVEAFKAKGHDIEKREINLPAGLIHEVGEAEIDIILYSDITVPVKVTVEAAK